MTVTTISTPDPNVVPFTSIAARDAMFRALLGFPPGILLQQALSNPGLFLLIRNPVGDRSHDWQLEQFMLERFHHQQYPQHKSNQSK